MLSNATYDYQINQIDRRWIGGGRFERAFEINEQLSFTAGVEGRYDDIGNVGLQHTEAGEFIETISQHSVRESSAGVYTEATWRSDRWLATHWRLARRLLRFRREGAHRRRRCWIGFDNAVSPKLGAAYTINDRIEVYGNWGKGFHSNDARGVMNTQTPVAGSAGFGSRSRRALRARPGTTDDDVLVAGSG